METGKIWQFRSSGGRIIVFSVGGGGSPLGTGLPFVKIPVGTIHLVVIIILTISLGPAVITIGLVEELTVTGAYTRIHFTAVAIQQGESEKSGSKKDDP
jgi:hypothetical protein